MSEQKPTVIVIPIFLLATWLEGCKLPALHAKATFNNVSTDWKRELHLWQYEPISKRKENKWKPRKSSLHYFLNPVFRTHFARISLKSIQRCLTALQGDSEWKHTAHLTLQTRPLVRLCIDRYVSLDDLCKFLIFFFFSSTIIFHGHSFNERLLM